MKVLSDMHCDEAKWLRYEDVFEKSFEKVAFKKRLI